ncbi:MAG: hypothetical protein ACE5JP_16415 [Candidatus Bipolaricaulia bacterium]
MKRLRLRFRIAWIEIVKVSEKQLGRQPGLSDALSQITADFRDLLSAFQRFKRRSSKGTVEEFANHYPKEIEAKRKELEKLYGASGSSDEDETRA